MSDYIKREDAIAWLEKWKETQIENEHDEGWNNGIDACINDIKHHIPTADVVEVQTILDAGMKGQEVEFRVGGRLFRIREVAQ